MNQPFLPHIIKYDDIDISIKLGSYEVNVLYLRYTPKIAIDLIFNHAHSSYELHFIPQGNGFLYTNNKAYVLKDNSFYITGPQVYHMQKSHDNNPMSEYCINFEFKETSVDTASEWNKIIKRFINTDFFISDNASDSIKLFDEIFNELKSKQVGYFEKVKMLISNIIINCTRLYNNNYPSEYEAPLKTLDTKRRLIIEAYFMKYFLNLTPEDLASKVGVSTRQLDRILKNYFSMGFKEKLAYCRLEASKSYMIDKSTNLEAISEKVGFTDYSYFSKLFKHYYGIAPIKYMTDIQNQHL